MFRNFFLISTILAFFCYSAGCRAIRIRSPFTCRSIKRIILIAFGVQTIIGTLNMIVVGNAIFRHTAVVVYLGINHCAILPNGSVTEVYNGITIVVLISTTETEQTGTSDVINRNIAANDIVARNVNCKLLRIGGVIDIQHLFGSIIGDTLGGYYSAILEIDDEVLVRTIIMDINDRRSFRIVRRVKSAMIKSL